MPRRTEAPSFVTVIASTPASLPGADYFATFTYLPLTTFRIALDARAVAVLVHGDLARHAGEVLQSGETVADPVAVRVEIAGLLVTPDFSMQCLYE